MFLRIKPIVKVDESLPVAGFDLDHTLIEPKSSNKVFPKDKDDWKWLYPDNIIVDKLTEVSKTHKVVVFTNQGSKNFNVEDFSYKICKIQEHISFMEARIAYRSADESADEDIYRKPNVGMWNSDFGDVKDGSFYVGDAAGREKDFSSSDKFFAKNLGIPFHIPEEFFLNENSVEIEKTHFTMLEEQHIICLVGYPASGKSTLARKLLNTDINLVQVGNDDAKVKVVRQMNKVLKEGKSVIVDRLNYSEEMRSEWIEMAKNFGIPIRCFHLKASMNDAMQFNLTRDKHISKIVYYKYRKNFEEPTEYEGFVDIVDVGSDFFA